MQCLMRMGVTKTNNAYIVVWNTHEIVTDNITFVKELLSQHAMSSGRPLTSLECPLKILTSGPPGEAQGTNTKIEELMKESVFQMQQLQFYTSITVFYWKKKYSKVLNGDVHRTSAGPSCETSQEPNKGMFWGRPKFNSEIY